MSTPLFLCHFYCDPGRCRPSTLLIWTIPSCEAAQSPGSCSEATHSLPTTDADSGQLLTLSLRALSNRALGCISSLICQKPHSLYSDGTCPMHTLFSLLAPAILLTWDYFFLPSFTSVYMHSSSIQGLAQMPTPASQFPRISPALPLILVMRIVI